MSSLQQRTAAPVRRLRRTGAAVVLTAVFASGLMACTAPDAQSADEITAVHEQARGLSSQQQRDHRRSDRALLDWAVELGLADPFSRSQLSLPDEYDAYGSRDQRLWDKYRDHIEQVSQSIRDHIRDNLHVDDVRKYYRQHPDEFSRQDAITVEVTEWEGTRAVATYRVDIDELSVRGLQERDDDVISAALQLQQDEQVNVDRADGRTAQVRCIRRTDAGVEPFDDVVQAAAARLADEMFTNRLAQRADTVRDHS